MFNRIGLLIATGFLVTGCNQKGKYQPNQKDLAGNTGYKQDSVRSAESEAEVLLTEKDLQLFCNNEMAPYCVLLPLQDFKEDFSDQSIEKAQHKFILKQDSANFTSIEVQAFTIDKKNYHNTKLFFNRDKRDIEEGGLGIDTAYIDEGRHFYLIKGYLPNYMNMRYAQLNWILEDRVAVYLNYDEKDEATWQRRITAIINRGVQYLDQ